MAQGEIHVGAVGLIFRRTIKIDGTVEDISAATTKQFIFRKPDGSLLSVDAVWTTDGTDAKAEYVTVAGDIDQPGEWRLQARLVMPNFDEKSDVDIFTVKANL
jgi:hypothetical protein